MTATSSPRCSTRRGSVRRGSGRPAGRVCGTGSTAISARKQRFPPRQRDRDILGFEVHQATAEENCEKGELVVEPESAKAFTRMLWGYNPGAVDAHVEMMTTKQQLLLDDVESLRTRLKDLGDESAAMRKKAAVLTDPSTAPPPGERRTG